MSPRRGGCRRCSATTWHPFRPSSGSTRTGTSAAPTRSTRASTPSPTRSRTSSSSWALTTSTGWTSPQMVDQHIQSGAGVTVAAIRQPIDMADQFGVIEVDDEDPTKISAFREKPSDPKGTPGQPGRDPRQHGQLRLHRRRPRRRRDPRPRSRREQARHGGDIVPAPWPGTRPTPTTSKKNVIPGGTDRDKGYWRDVGTLDSYFDAHMDLISIHHGSSTSTTMTGRSTPTTVPTLRRSSSTALTAASVRALNSAVSRHGHLRRA